VLSVRPKVAELTFQLFGRPLHPELFAVVETCTIEREHYSVKIDITGAGHVIAWRYAGITLTEVAAPASQPLPSMRRLLCYNLKGQREDSLECRGGASYHTNFQLEPTNPAMFWRIQRELAEAGSRQGMWHHFNSSGRVALGALSYLNFEARQRSFLVQAFHTFPEDNAIVRSESLFKLP